MFDVIDKGECSGQVLTQGLFGGLGVFAGDGFNDSPMVSHNSLGLAFGR